jgi:cell division protein FtsL
MAIKLNLLPPEKEVNQNLNSFLKTTKALGVIGIVAFLIFGIGMAIFFISSTISLNNINSSIKSLSSKVLAQQKSEQKIILVKDRINKIASIQKLPSSLTSLDAINPYLENINGVNSIGDLRISPTTVNLSLKIQKYSDLSSLIESLESSDKFESVSLGSFNLNPSTGYSLEIKTENK